MNVDNLIVTVAQACPHRLKSVWILLKVEDCEQTPKQMHIEPDTQAAFDDARNLTGQTGFGFRTRVFTGEQPAVRLPVKFHRTLDQCNALGCQLVRQDGSIFGFLPWDPDNPSPFRSLLDHLNVVTQIETNQIFEPERREDFNLHCNRGLRQHASIARLDAAAFGLG